MTAATPEGTPVAGPQGPQPGDPTTAGGPTPGGVLTPAQLSLLAAVLDRLVPAAGDLPGAGGLGGAGEVDVILAARPALRPAILDALRAIEVEAARTQAAPGAPGTPGDPGAAGEGPFLALGPEQRDGALRAAERAAPVPFRALVRQAYSAYYSHPAVLRAVGYGAPSGAPDNAPAPQPAGFPLAPFDESRLDAVRRRGQLWREA